MSGYPLLMKTLALLIFAGLLTACGGSSGTEDNPNLKSADDSYTGPPASTADTRSFQLNFWEYMRKDNRCGQCHGDSQSPTFVNSTDVNKAYSEAIKYVNLQNPQDSRIVIKVSDKKTDGHHCWLTSLDACAATLEQMISNWANDSNITSARLIQLKAPDHELPGEAKSFPPNATTPGINGRSFEDTVYPLLIGTIPVIANNNCQNCHQETGPPLPQAPFFASPELESAFEAAKSKMNIDTPANSRFVERLQQLHNCWTNCPADAAAMTAAIKLFADGIEETEVDTTLLTSMALKMTDGVVAAGGNRHEGNLVALWEFKTRGGITAYDTSGIDPAVDLTLISDINGSVGWLDSYGLNFQGGRAQAFTFDSEKLHDFIQATGEYAIEAWIVPANVSQEQTNIVSYSGSDNARNFTLGQDLYNYDFYNRIVTTPPRPNGDPFLSSGDNDEEIAEANLQHVVVNYDPDTGRSIFVNGVLVDVTDPAGSRTTINNVWDDGFTLVLGNETSGNRPWFGHVRMLAIHNRNLTQEQVTQNFDVGVGEKYFLLFYVGHHISIPKSYIVFEVSQFDEFSYLFNRPTFINLDPDWTPVTIDIAGLRIGINGKEAVAGQAYGSLDTSVNGSYDPQLGQQLSPLGTIIALEKGATSDEFFLTFESIGTENRTYTEPRPTVPDDPTDPSNKVESDIGIRTFEEINATIASITGIPVTNAAVNSVYTDYTQQLPTVEAIDAFLPSHQMAIAQLALTSCSELLNNGLVAGAHGFFPGLDFDLSAQTAFGAAAPGVPDAAQQANRGLVVDPLMTAAMNVDSLNAGNNLTSQPDEIDISGLLGAGTSQNLDTGDNVVAYDSLITQLINTCTPVAPATTCTLEDTPARTVQIVKAVCATAVGGAVMLVQ
ncbi:MAG: LamG domain-containing protein [Gammaproteobacteria bacterium]|nr:LamG domain-containing protein [Gammaproteobacteria bacterium]